MLFLILSLTPSSKDRFCWIKQLECLRLLADELCVGVHSSMVPTAITSVSRTRLSLSHLAITSHALCTLYWNISNDFINEVVWHHSPR